MARSALPAFDGPVPQYYSLVTDYAGNVLGQVRSLEISDSVDVTKAGRVGSSTKKTLKKTKDTNASLEVWVDSDLAEVAVALNASTPAVGETLKLDPDASSTTLYIKNYDGESASATLLSTIGLYGYLATELSMTLDEDGEQVLSISATLEDLYWLKES